MVAEEGDTGDWGIPMTSKLFLAVGLAIWASIAVTGYFSLNLVWNLDHLHLFHATVAMTLIILWLGWVVLGGILGTAFIVVGLED
jgi:hypothetical protein